MSKQEPEIGEENKQCGIQVIARAAAIMRTLGEHPHGLSLAAIAQAVDLPRSTVQRIVGALEAEYLVEAICRSGGFRLGPALGRLIHRTQTDIITVVRPYLEQLANQLQESVSLSKQAGKNIYVIDRIVAERELRVVFPIGIHVPLHSTASGKVLLSRLSDEQVRDLLPDPLPPMTCNTHDLPTLLNELATIRKTGVAIEQEENTEGMSSVAVLLDTYLGPFTIAVVVPSPRTARRIDLFKKALLECKQEIERMIGGNACKP